jgi:pimeloyl-ACP methyl ester carboxylesterase
VKPIRRSKSVLSVLHVIVVTFIVIAVWAPRSGHANVPAAPVEGFVETNGVRLQYLEWTGPERAGARPTLILLHGLGDNPHIFDDLASAFTDRFRVIAYARRGSGSSDVKGPYDVVTLTADLRGLMDALGVAKAALVGHSAGGDEITRMAAEYPARVDRIIYLDAAYDWADPEFHKAYDALVKLDGLQRPAAATASLDALRAYAKATAYQSLDDMRRVEAHLRAGVVIQPDGSVKDRLPREVRDALYAALWVNPRREYTRVRCAALAIYPEHVSSPEALQPDQRAGLLAYENTYWNPFRTRSIERVRRELHGVEIVHVPGIHSSFFLTDRQPVVAAMRKFLSEGVTPASARTQ